MPVFGRKPTRQGRPSSIARERASAIWARSTSAEAEMRASRNIVCATGIDTPMTTTRTAMTRMISSRVYADRRVFFMLRDHRDGSIRALRSCPRSDPSVLLSFRPITDRGSIRRRGEDVRFSQLVMSTGFYVLVFIAPGIDQSFPAVEPGPTLLIRDKQLLQAVGVHAAVPGGIDLTRRGEALDLKAGRVLFRVGPHREVGNPADANQDDDDGHDNQDFHQRKRGATLSLLLSFQDHHTPSFRTLRTLSPANI